MDEEKVMWALIELFGHQRIAGQVTEAELGAGNLIRVDVPGDGDKRSPLTKYFNVKSIYALTPIDETTALRMAKDINPAPVSEYSLEREFGKMQARLKAGRDGTDDDQERMRF